ncbi:putative gustatory receptor 28a [Schistocerca nitens]|uniref:putative gustatory receptor 28a n=1 Tax=Schistocerca nitens TaxID=7011 RepID=UPI002118ACFF|nr:putative gustatory receptor 28a [Schistocerca nitens]
MNAMHTTQNAVHCLLKISKILGTAPISFEDNKGKYVVSSGCKCYSTLMASLILILVTCGAATRLSQLTGIMDDVVLRIDTYNILLGVVTAIFLMLRSVTLKQRYVDIWCMNLLSVDIFLYRNNEPEYFKISRLVRRMLFGVVLISFIIYSGFILIPEYRFQFDLLIPLYFCFGLRNIVVLQFFTFNVVLYRRFLYLNKRLLEIFCFRSECDLDRIISLLLKANTRNYISVFPHQLRSKDSCHLSLRERLEYRLTPNMRFPTQMTLKLKGCVPISHIQKVHCLLHDMARYVTAGFGVQIVIEVTFSFFNVVVNTYILVARLLQKEVVSCGQPAGMILMDCLPWLLMSASRLVLIACSSEAVAEQSNRMLELVNKLLLVLPQGDYEHHTALQKFARQLHYNRLSYSAARLFTIDRSLVTSCVATITTYLVILIQFSMAKITVQQNNKYSC